MSPSSQSNSIDNKRKYFRRCSVTKHSLRAMQVELRGFPSDMSVWAKSVQAENAMTSEEFTINSIFAQPETDKIAVISPDSKTSCSWREGDAKRMLFGGAEMSVVVREDAEVQSKKTKEDKHE